MPQIDLIDHGNIRELQMVRPPVNALDPGLLEAIHAALVESGRSHVQALILSGASNVFSAGLDLPALLELNEVELTDFWRLLIETLRWIAMSPIPVIAAITGHCPAGGTVLTLFADYRIQARGDYRIGLNEVQVGLSVPRSVYRGLVRLIGIHPAERMATQGLLITPDEALRVGLVDEVVDPEVVRSRAVTLAQTWLDLPSLAFRETRNTARCDLGSIFEQGDDPEQLTHLWFHADVQRALRECVTTLKNRSAASAQARLRST
ncbi:MAG: enoyl-CoA hydratase/isomerase family protein [Gammaproteobacteria bacterium]